MSFEDELKELILNAKAESERRSQELITFRNGWNSTKLNVVKPAFDQTVKALQAHSRFQAVTELRNGSIHLRIGPQGPQDVVTHQLTFSPIEEKLEIACSYKTDHLVVESFTLDNLDQGIVENKIKEFLAAALNG